MTKNEGPCIRLRFSCIATVIAITALRAIQQYEKKIRGPSFFVTLHQQLNFNVIRCVSSCFLSLCSTLDTRTRCPCTERKDRITCERRQESLVVLAGNRILKTFAGHSVIRPAYILVEHSVFHALSNDVICSE